MLRHADPQRDAAACAAIYAPHVEGRGTSFEERAPTEEQFAARIERVSERHPWLVAERGGEVAGFAYATLHRARPAYRWAAETSVYIHADHQGRGAGTELYTALIELLRQQGLHVAVAGITLPNPASVRLHESLGFEPVGVYRRIGFKAGDWRDVGWWQLFLTPQDDGPLPEPLGPQALIPR
jgi:L-amino acid N-acyltransferase YncA